jgi:hypothetical protein
LKAQAEELLLQIKADPVGNALLGERVQEKLQRLQITFFDETTYRCEATIIKEQ